MSDTAKSNRARDEALCEFDIAYWASEWAKPGPLQNRLGRQVAEILKGLNLDKVFFSQKLQTRCEDLEIVYN